MKLRERLIAGVTCGVVGLSVTGVALAAAALPKAGGNYFNKSKPHGSFVDLVISSSNTKQILAGPDIYHGGTMGSNVDPACPKGQAQAGFNGTTLKLSNGKYGFSDRWTSHAKIIEETSHGEKFVPVKLNIKITGTVKDANTIIGAVSWKGCDGSKTDHTEYTATYHKSL